ncbi:MAG: DinB family protein [Chloroflexi bacterium]|nr:DinB family protein [Chloroflexota bacterium]
MTVISELEDAIVAVGAVIDEALAFFGQTPDRTAAPGGSWGPKEVLAHLVWWHTFTCESVEGVLAGREPQPPSRPVEAINAEAAAQAAGTSVATLAEQFGATHARLIEAMRRLPDPSVVVMRRSDGAAFDAPSRLNTLARHVAGHLAELRQGAA